MKRITKHLNPATGIAFIALIFAVTGVSFAATGGGGNGGNSGGGGRASNQLTASASKAKPKAKAGPRGPAGKNGATGATGPAGPAGAAGKEGAPGTPGKEGAPGAAGAQGKEGAQGNEGAQGQPGSPWTPGFLPAGATETGTFTAPEKTVTAPGPPTERELTLPISFAIPLESELDKEHFEIVTATSEHRHHGGTGTECAGTAANPTAPSGFLCVYLAAEPPKGPLGIAIFQSGAAAEEVGVSKAGAILWYEREENEAENNNIYGTWAVTG